MLAVGGWGEPSELVTGSAGPEGLWAGLPGRNPETFLKQLRGAAITVHTSLSG